MRAAHSQGAANHPELLERNDALLLGIHDRLGVLCDALAPSAGKGPDFLPLSGDYLSDLIALEYEK